MTNYYITNAKQMIKKNINESDSTKLQLLEYIESIKDNEYHDFLWKFVDHLLHIVDLKDYRIKKEF